MSVAVFILPIRSWKMNGFGTADALAGVNFENLIFFFLLAIKWLIEYVSKHCGFEPFHHFAGCDRNQNVKSEHAHFYAFLTAKKCTWKCKKSDIFTRVKKIKLLPGLCCSEEQIWAVSHTTHTFGVSDWNIGDSDTKRGAPGGVNETGWKMPSDPFSAAIFRLDFFFFWKLVCSSVRSSTLTGMLFTFWCEPRRVSYEAEKCKLCKKNWLF